MPNLVIFLNELSFACAPTVSVDQMLRHVICTLATARAAKRRREDIIVAGNVPFAAIRLGDGSRSLAEFFAATETSWRFLLLWLNPVRGVLTPFQRCPDTIRKCGITGKLELECFGRGKTPRQS